MTENNNDKSVMRILRQGLTDLTMTGSDRHDFLNRMTTNIVGSLRPGQGVVTILTDERGRVIDVLIVTEQDNGTRVLGSRDSAEAVFRWFKKFIIADDVRILDTSQQNGAIDIIGPTTLQIMADIFGIDASALMMGFNAIASAGFGEFLCVRIPSHNEVSFRVYGSAPDVEQLWQYLEEHSTISVLDAVLDTQLRISSGIGLYGREWSLDYNPLEAGLLHYVNFRKGCYVGQEVIARLDAYDKVKQRLVGFNTRIPVNDADTVFDETGAVIGRITTAASLPSNGGPTCYSMGYVRTMFAHNGAPVFIGNRTEGTVVTLPAGEIL